jgi:iron complex transport system substrate-binding protein
LSLGDADHHRLHVIARQEDLRPEVRGPACLRVAWSFGGGPSAGQPDVVVVAACGYDRLGTTALAHDLASRGVLPPRVRLVAVDANASWARPGTRLVDGIEELADFLHPARDRAVA